MSRLAGILLLVLGATAFAETTEPAETPAPPPKVEAPAASAKSSKFPLRVVKILAESEQALLFDKNRGRHVLVEVGEAVGDYTIASIDEDEVTLAGKDIPVEVVLAAPETRESKKAKRAAKKAAADKAAAADAAPEDPYAATAKKAPADPYAEDDAPSDETARDVSAAIGGAEIEDKPIRAVTWGKEGEKSTTSPFATMDADAAKPSADVANAGKPATKPAPKGQPAPAPTSDDETDADAPAIDAKPTAPATKKPPSWTPEDAEAPIADAPATAMKADAPTRLSKKEVNLALNDFASLSSSIDGSFTAKGLTLDKVAASSVFAKAGLVAGDIVTAVNGKPLRTIDDAADLYARAGSMKSANVQILRAGKPQTLRIAIQ
jgi:hypothetical protein